MSYRLLATDMDGTLLNDDSVMTERTRAAVQRAIDSGVLFVPSTGRPLRGVRFLNEAFADDLPFITFNGAIVVTGKTGRVLFARGLDFGSAAEIFRSGKGNGYPVILWIGDGLYVSRDCDAVQQYRGIAGAELNVVSEFEALRGRDIAKMLWLVPPGDALRLQSAARERFSRVNAHISRPYMLEFVAKDVSKARALEVIGEVYGIDKSEMIAVGDSYNDAAMLQYAGLSVAMANAPEEIKAMCREITLSNNEDGVAAVIEKWIAF
jgi:Cof subfamily protein (haloacid dehalogenase superfamily)